MVEKNSYKISDIIISLKDYLREGYEILEEMLNLIDIKSNAPYKTHIKVMQGDANNLFCKHITYKEEPYEGQILLFIFKSRFTPARMIRNYKTRFEEERNPLYSIDNADYIIKKEGEDFIFEKRYNHNLPRTYDPSLSILNKEKFAKLYKRLEDEGYLTFPSIQYFHHDEEPDYSLNIGSQCISLEQVNWINDRELFIRYDPLDDSFFIKDNRKNPKLSAKQMLDIEIDRSEIYKGYASIIDRNLASREELTKSFSSKNQRLLGISSEEKGKQKALRRVFRR
jgi:hypothetical protein